MAAILRRLGREHPVLDEVGTRLVLGHGDAVGSVRAVV
jgi:hypothetical protein